MNPAKEVFNQRYICDVLKEMRACNETRNYSLLSSLIEEAQIYANRMENAISIYKPDNWYIEHKETQFTELSEKVKKLRAEVVNLEANKAMLKMELQEDENNNNGD